MPIRALRSFTSSDRFAETLCVALLILIFVKFPGVLLLPFAIALAAIPAMLVCALSVTKWALPVKAGAVLAAMFLELWAFALFGFAHAFAYDKPFLSFFE